MGFIVEAFSKFISNIVSSTYNNINTIISSYLPGLDTIIAYIDGFIDLICDNVAFVSSYIGFYPIIWQSFFIMISAGFGIIVATDLVKLVVRWWHWSS